jgi:hypothetical protein
MYKEKKNKKTNKQKRGQKYKQKRKRARTEGPLKEILFKLLLSADKFKKFLKFWCNKNHETKYFKFKKYSKNTPRVEHKATFFNKFNWRLNYFFDSRRPLKKIHLIYRAARKK